MIWCSLSDQLVVLGLGLIVDSGIEFTNRSSSKSGSRAGGYELYGSTSHLQHRLLLAIREEIAPGTDTHRKRYQVLQQLLSEPS